MVGLMAGIPLAFEGERRRKKWFRNGALDLRVPISSFRVQVGIAPSHSSLRLTTSGLNLPPLITSFPGNRVLVVCPEAANYSSNLQALALLLGHRTVCLSCPLTPGFPQGFFIFSGFQ